jgi:hypothetical protein
MSNHENLSVFGNVSWLARPRVWVAAGLVVSATLAGCSGSDGAAGTVGESGATGPKGVEGAAGQAGANGQPGKTGPAGKPGAPGTTDLSELQVPGPDFFPTGLYASKDGSLFVSSAGTGEVIKYVPGAITPKVIVPASGAVAPDLIVDDSTGTLYVCVDQFGAPGFMDPMASLAAYDLEGKSKQSYPLPNQGSSLCEDIAIDAQHNVYVTDAFLGAIYVLPAKGTSLEPWASDPSLAASSSSAPPFGAHGITYDGVGNLYVDNFNTSALYRIPILASGSAGAIAQVTVDPPVVNPESLRMVDSHSIMIGQGAFGVPNDNVSLITLGADDTATATIMMNGLEGASSIALMSDGSLWVTQSQTSAFVFQTQPNLPFLLSHLLAD